MSGEYRITALGSEPRHHVVTRDGDWVASFETIDDARAFAAMKNGELIDGAIESEQVRWQERIDKTVFRMDPDRDGSGSDSGDPLDLTMTEIDMAFDRVVSALNDAIHAPMGVVPKSCEIYYDPKHKPHADNMVKSALAAVEGKR